MLEGLKLDVNGKELVDFLNERVACNPRHG